MFWKDLAKRVEAAMIMPKVAIIILTGIEER